MTVENKYQQNLPPYSGPGTHTESVHLEGTRKLALETGRNRLLVTGAVLALAYVVIAARLVQLTLFEPTLEPRLARFEPMVPPSLASSVPPAGTGRANIVDRNGIVLASSLPTVSLYADPQDVLDAADAADRVVTVLPTLHRAEVLAKLRADNRFAWIKRNLTPTQHYQVNRLGLPGLSFQNSESRVYPHGREAAHVLGMTDVDGRGISGVEGYFDRDLRGRTRALQLSIDIRAQAILHEELSNAVRTFDAKAASGLVMDVRSGEILAMVSLPDFDPNIPASTIDGSDFNSVTKGVYEMGSTFKLFTVAMALDSGTVSLRDGYDASQPIHVARFTISDYHGKNRWLSVPEILIYSSNIGAAKMALDVGSKAQQRYLRQLGLLSPAFLELPEIGVPLKPARWRDINTMTIAYGHGVAVSPLQLVDAVSTVVNGGIQHPPTLIKRRGDPPAGARVLSAKTSRAMRGLMRRVVQTGTGKKADVPGYRVGGKTGTAEKQVAGGYQGHALISSFVGVFPMDAPRFVVLALLDEPKGNDDTNGYATGGWVAAPVVGSVIRRLGTLVGMAPDLDEVKPAPDKPLLVALKGLGVGAREHGLAAN